jgi:hypothetical protein
MNELIKTHVLKHSPSPVYGHTLAEIYQDVAGRYWLYKTCSKSGCPGHRLTSLLPAQVLQWVIDGEAVPVKHVVLAYLAS